MVIICCKAHNTCMTDNNDEPKHMAGSDRVAHPMHPFKQQHIYLAATTIPNKSMALLVGFVSPSGQRATMSPMYYIKGRTRTPL